MERYGENITHEDVSAEPTRKELSNAWLFLGGSKVTFGTISSADGEADPESSEPKDSFTGLLSFLSLRKARKNQ